MMEAPFHINPLIQLWHILKASYILKHSLLKFFKLMEISTMQVLVLMEDH
jgi:hypothetical protein